MSNSQPQSHIDQPDDNASEPLKTSLPTVSGGEAKPHDTKSTGAETKEAAEHPLRRHRRKALILAKRKTAAATQLLAKGQAGHKAPAFPNVTPLVTLPPPPAQRVREPRRIRRMFWSALIFVGIPTLLGFLYYEVLASDQYAARADFVIKSRVQAPIDGISMLGISSANPTSISDMLVVQEYVASKQMLQDISPAIDLRKIYTNPKIDWWARLKPWPDLGWGDQNKDAISEEELLNYWQSMVQVHFDMTTGISTLTVRAFTASDAANIANHVLDLSEKLVNRLSERAQADSLVFARKEVDDAHGRAIESLDALQAFQQKAQQVDPEGFAKARSEIQAGTEASLSQLQAQLEILRKNLPEDAPGIVQLKNRIVVVQQQLMKERQRSTKGPAGDSATEVLTEFGKLRMDADFATKAYTSALSSLEQARVNALQQSRYLVAFVRPHVPDLAEYPRRILAIFVIFLVSTTIWVIGRLVVALIKEHI